MPAGPLLGRLVKMLISVITWGALDKKLGKYVTDFLQRLMKKVMFMVAGFAVALVGLMFLSAALAKFLNETLNSTWIGWGAAGIIMLGTGLIVYVGEPLVMASHVID